MAKERKKKPGDDGTKDESEKRRKKMNDEIEMAFRVSLLPDTIQAEYRKTLTEVLEALKPTAQERVFAHVKEYKFYRTNSELTAVIQSKYPGVRVRGILKGCFDRDGTLHLNGSGKLFGRTAKLSEFYAHEVTHAIDGVAHEISSLQAWQTAWEAERELMSKNGQSKASEGFAEFGELLLGSGITRKQIKEVMPRCLKVWEKNKL